MPDDRELLPEFSWKQIFPGLILYRALKTSLAPPLMLLATIGCLLTPVGWNVAKVVFVGDAEEIVSSNENEEPKLSDPTKPDANPLAPRREPADPKKTGSQEKPADAEPEDGQEELSKADEGPTAEDLADEGPADKGPTDEGPTDEDLVEEGPGAEDPVEKDPVEEDPVEEDPVEEDPVEEDPAEVDAAEQESEVKEELIHSQFTDFPGSSLRDGDIEFSEESLGDQAVSLVRRSWAAMTGMFQRAVLPFQRFFSEPSWSNCFFLTTGSLWSLLVWGLIGGAITRVAVVRLGCDEAVPIRSALTYAGKRLWTYVFSPLFPLLTVLLLSIPMWVMGLLMRYDPLVFFVGLVWIVVLLVGLGMAYQLLGTMFGWPLMWVVISAEETGDHYEAYSRSFAYTFQRPFHYLFYAALAVLLGGLGWLLVQVFAELTIHMAYWSIMWGYGLQNIERLRDAGTDAGAMFWAGRSLMDLSEGFIRLIAGAFAYSFFWCAASAIYLLLRKAVDETEFDEIFMDDDQPPFELPSMSERESVVPEIKVVSASSDASEAPVETDSTDQPGADDTPKSTDSEQPSKAQDADAADDDDMQADDPEEELMF